MVEFIFSIYENFIIFIFPVLGNIVTIIISISAALTAFFAWRGLSIWKKQFKAKIEYNLAHRLLISAYKYRDAISFIRQAGVIYYYSLEDKNNTYLNDQIYYNHKCKYYENLLPSIDDLKAKIYLNAFESEIHWNSDLRSLVDELARVENDIRNTLKKYLKLSKQRSGMIMYTKDWLETEKKFFVKPGAEDEFSKEIASLIKGIEDFLKPKLELRIDPNPLVRALRWILASKIRILACVGTIIFIVYDYIIFTK